MASSKFATDDGLCMSFKKVNNRGLKQYKRRDLQSHHSCVCHSKK